MSDPRLRQIPLRLTRRALLGGALGAYFLPLSTRPTHVDADTDANAAWSDAAPMPTPHAFHAATLLGDGNLLVTGGRDGQTTLDTATRYDPVADQWTIAAPMPIPRSQHAALLLPDGRVFVVGNYQVNVIDAIVYDPVADQWVTVAPLPTPYGPAGAALLPDGQVLALTCNPQRYDPLTDQWTATGPLHASGACTLGNAFTNLIDGRVLITGGPYRGGGYNDCALYNPTSNTWMATGLLQAGRAFHTATALPDGGALVVGGMDLRGLVTTAERYDPSRNQWVPAASPHVARSGHTALLLSDGSLLVVGGIGAMGDSAPSTTAERYDPTTDTWSDAGVSQPARTGHAITLLDTGDVLVTGGVNDPKMPTRASTFAQRFTTPHTGLGTIRPYRATNAPSMRTAAHSDAFSAAAYETSSA